MHNFAPKLANEQPTKTLRAGVRAKHSLGAAPIPEDHDDHHLEPWTSDIDNAQWLFNFDWETEFWPLPRVENSDSLGFFDFGDYHDTCVGALDTDPTFLAPQDDVFNVEASNSHLTPVIEPSAFLDPMQGAANLSQNILHSLTAHDLVSCQQPDLPPPVCTSPSSDAPTSISPASSGYEKRSPQSSTSSPASNTAQLSCGFCRQSCNDVDSLYIHLVSSHVTSRPFHCGRASCNKTFKDASIDAHVVMQFDNSAHTNTTSKTVVKEGGEGHQKQPTTDEQRKNLKFWDRPIG
ncbi:hypothetical protein FPANT_12586 [Fusarium pseudoanthophilum]|uniref:C2H2-type domain-containing protein n=1 Tax=Fusarium pseudoanthophilum TaxID=48495 RepID=A0A8H5KGU5_9HYPO|nr:hypothetical protein FPANT_12586 [Fusarium pseudoanthophilum]